MAFPKVRRNRILFVDAEDSFTNNIISLLETRLHVSVYVWKINLKLEHGTLVAALSYFDAIVLGPGPGNPTKDGDIGIMNDLCKIDGEGILPMLGICLGFQCLALAFGAKIERLKEPKHGMICDVTHNCESIFEGVQSLHATCYHSLRVDMGQATRSACGFLNSGDLWGHTKACPELQPLGWDLDDEVNGPVLMALRHLQKPFWGLQYHPESVCTNQESFIVIENWWSEAMRWHQHKNHSTLCAQMPSIDKLGLTFQNQLMRVQESHFRQRLFLRELRSREDARVETKSKDTAKVITAKISTGAYTPTEICDYLGLGRSELIVLDTAVVREETGRFTIIGLVDRPRTVTLEYTAGSPILVRRRPGRMDVALESLKEYQWDVYRYLADYMESRRAIGGLTEIPFWGGLVGYITYEMCLSTLSVPLSPLKSLYSDGRSQPDMIFAFIDRSLVYDHQTGCMYVQSICSDDNHWVQSVKEKIELFCSGCDDWPDAIHANGNGVQLREEPQTVSDRSLAGNLQDGCCLQISPPDATVYQAKIRQCQEYIRAGDSYELCLTSQAQVRVRRSIIGDYMWSLYLALRKHNPAPFGTYFRVGQATLLGCSPERFLGWDRNGFCQMRPIKGTVKKGPGVNRQLAEDLLSQPKEQAENLMIVDLIRHDMHGVLGSGNVSVRRLMQVEEYETVYQLVSVIEGPAENNTASGSSCEYLDNGAHPTTNAMRKGLGLLAASLPPGSMTGAPKQRSCDLLCDLEDKQPRGIYSGVVGYMCVGGGGDFSVVIRSAFKWGSATGNHAFERHGSKDNVTPAQNSMDDDYDTWRIGAGGAITALSTPEDEWEEMQTKLKSTLDPLIAHLKERIKGTTG